jgi:hypothetical protein
MPVQSERHCILASNIRSSRQAVTELTDRYIWLHFPGEAISLVAQGGEATRVDSGRRRVLLLSHFAQNQPIAR